MLPPGVGEHSAAFLRSAGLTEHEIENLLARYCELFDSGDMDGYVALFTDAHIANHFAESSGPEELRALSRAMSCGSRR